MTTSTLSAESRPRDASIYNRIFWLSYLANALGVAANALTFRFAEFVAFLGGTEQISGNIVSTGVIVAVLMRLGLGQAIDRYGTRHLWLFSALLFAVSCGLFLVRNQITWEIYAARILFSMGLAGMFSCSIVHIQNQVPPQRRTEIIGSLGSSGFLGMIVGPQIGDLIFREIPEGELRFQVLFGCAAALGAVYLGVVLWLTRGEKHSRPHETPAAHRLMFRYWPGPIVLVALMMGVGFTVISVFLTRFATFLGLRGIGTFFIGYSAAAFAFRLATRSWSDTVGRHRMVLLGLAGVGCGQFMFLLVSADWHLLFPALSCGFGHALLFPAVVSLGAGAFPPHYRGSGTTLVLGFSEIGTVLSAPILGAIIDYFNEYGFEAMFLTTGGTAACIGVYYALTAARRPDRDLQLDPEEERRHRAADAAKTKTPASDTALPIPEMLPPTVCARVGKLA